MRLAAVLLLAFCVTGSVAAGDATAKKKKHKVARVFAASVSPNLAIPDQPAPPGHDIVVSSTVTIGKKFKGRTVGDVNVTGIKTTGSATGAANDLSLSLTAPNGRLVLLEATALSGQSVGPLTFDDDTPTSICSSPTPTCPDPDATLVEPFAGTANLLGLNQGDIAPLSTFNGGPMRGTWTFQVWDNSDDGDTSVLNSWGVQVTAERPVS